MNDDIQNTNGQVVDSSKLDSQIIETANKIMNGDNVDETKDLVALFNWNMSRKNVSRILKLNGLLDDVADQMVYRFKNRGDQFTNSDLLDYMKTIQTAVDTSTKNLNQVDEPPMIVNQTNTQINVNMGGEFDRDAKQRIIDAIQATLKSVSSNEVVDATFEEQKDTTADGGDE